MQQGTFLRPDFLRGSPGEAAPTSLRAGRWSVRGFAFPRRSVGTMQTLIVPPCRPSFPRSSVGMQQGTLPRPDFLRCSPGEAAPTSLRAGRRSVRGFAFPRGSVGTMQTLIVPPCRPSFPRSSVGMQQGTLPRPDFLRGSPGEAAPTSLRAGRRSVRGFAFPRGSVGTIPMSAGTTSCSPASTLDPCSPLPVHHYCADQIFRQTQAAPETRIAAVEDRTVSDRKGYREMRCPD
jgi:hypothetical protein